MDEPPLRFVTVWSTQFVGDSGVIRVRAVRGGLKTANPYFFSHLPMNQPQYLRLHIITKQSTFKNRGYVFLNYRNF